MKLINLIINKLLYSYDKDVVLNVSIESIFCEWD
jgi:hypothetical protein